MKDNYNMGKKRYIILRAHHLLCIPHFYSGGYNKEFGDNMKQIIQDIRKNPDIKIKVVMECDDLCTKCPYKKGDICKKTPKLNKWILRQDEKVFKELKIKPNSIHTAKEIFSKSSDINITSICKSCVFFRNCIKIGINKSFIKDVTK